MGTPMTTGSAGTGAVSTTWTGSGAVSTTWTGSGATSTTWTGSGADSTTCTGVGTTAGPTATGLTSAEALLMFRMIWTRGVPVAISAGAGATTAGPGTMGSSATTPPSGRG
uniref:SFRICE_033109 n=1 Tax=Spodoptera frugiperda TaxID=7108 RepID=A0A2H1VP56_SPOFR